MPIAEGHTVKLALMLAAGAIPQAWGAVPIQHIVVIMQENRSFDSYFGTFPGADGFPPGVCVPLNPAQPSLGCAVPFHDQNDVNAGGPHRPQDAELDLNDGISTALLNGFVYQQSTAQGGAICKKNPNLPQCTTSLPGVLRHDVMGYHTDSEIPNYWAYARHFVLQDHLFESVRSWSLPAHLYLTSEWAATCTNPKLASSCITTTTLTGADAKVEIPWVSLFQLLDRHQVSWKYYLGDGPEPDCADGDMVCDPPAQTSSVPSIWNQVPNYRYVRQRGASYLVRHVTNSAQFLADVQGGTLPQVAWVVPAQPYSEHPPGSITMGMEYVTAMVNALMKSSYWANTAIFITWDDWGGFYDHEVPPIVDSNATAYPVQGYGLRVPGLLVSAYARRGFVDHSYYSFDSYATLIEDWFMGGERLIPANFNNPDSRPTIRDALSSGTLINGTHVPLGDLAQEFDFTSPLQPKLVLSNTIPSGISAVCNADKVTQLCRRPTVAVSWTPAPSSIAEPRFVYHVLRDGVELPGCAGASPQCTDTPPAGSHYYRAYSVDNAGVVSPQSAAAEIDMQ